MIFARKSSTPIDRAVADLERQIAELEQKTRQSETPSQPTGKWKEWFAPPPRHMTTTTRRPLPNIPVEPLKDLEQAPLPFERQPDLFNRPVAKSAKPRAPLGHAKQLNRRRFYLCLGLGIVVLGLLWLVVH
jgi:hypothetical protein